MKRPTIFCMDGSSFRAGHRSIGNYPWFPGGNRMSSWRNPLHPAAERGTFVATKKTSHSREGSVAEIRIEEKKRGAPWILILLLLIVAAIIGWWLWSNRTTGSETTGAPSGAVADSIADTTRTR
jgi:hypothetical protein